MMFFLEGRVWKGNGGRKVFFCFFGFNANITVTGFTVKLSLVEGDVGDYFGFLSQDTYSLTHAWESCFLLIPSSTSLHEYLRKTYSFCLPACLPVFSVLLLINSM
ncbi:hypothetical protein BZA77DRAFT_94655 [Pyronema omphalodes]|nr:hypothetical protein BZA77DRAFT_94655 [Pyronema omphalodes]